VCLNLYVYATIQRYRKSFTISPDQHDQLPSNNIDTAHQDLDVTHTVKTRPQTYDMLVHWPRAEPICSSTLSSHCRGPFKCISIQHGVLVIVWRLQQTMYDKIGWMDG